MNRTSHPLQTLKFDISFSSEGQAIDLHKKISRLSNEKVYAIIAKVFDEELPDKRVFVKIDQLEIDLGEISYAELGQLLPERVYRLLKQTVRQQLALSDRTYPIPQPSSLKRSEDQYKADALYFFLKKGVLPWWATDGKGLQLEQLFFHLLKIKQQEVLAVIYNDGNFLNIIQRITYQFSDRLLTTLADALSPLYAKQLIDYSTDITRYAGALKPIAYTQRQYKWIMLLTFLNPNDQGGRDVVKSMVKFFLGRLAGGNNLTVPVLIDHFRNEFASQAPVNDVGHRLQRITMELLTESAKNPDKKTPANTLEKVGADWEKAKIERKEINIKAKGAAINVEEKRAGEQPTAGQSGRTSMGDSLAEKAVQDKQSRANNAREVAAGDGAPGIPPTGEQSNIEPQGALLSDRPGTHGLIEKEAQNLQTTANNAGDVTPEDIAPGMTAELPPADIELLQLRQHNRELYQYLSKFVSGYNDNRMIKYGVKTKARPSDFNSQDSSVERLSADGATTGQQPDEGIAANQMAREDETYSKPDGRYAAVSTDGEALIKKRGQEKPGGTGAGEGPPPIMKELQPLIQQLLQLKQYDSGLHRHIIDFIIQYNQKWKLNKDVRVYARDLFDHIVARHSSNGRAMEVLEATLLKMGYRAGKRNQAHPRFREEFNQDKIDVYYIENAGLVLLGPILGTYYERLFLMKNNEFISKTAQDKAVQMLQFLVNGTENNSEDVLLLNKILCGMDITSPVEKEVPINERDKETALSLLNAVRDNWPALKNSSVETFRAEFLQRSGKLNFYNGEWVLRVEHNGRSDYLLDSLPWSFRMIKHSWMPEILNVEWT